MGTQSPTLARILQRVEGVFERLLEDAGENPLALEGKTRMLLAYTVLRHAYPEGFAEAWRETKIVIGSVNTAVLLTSSATMAWAVHAAKAGHRKLLTILLIATAALGLVFVGLKGLEYSQEYAEHLVPGLNFSSDSPHAHAIELFYFLYFGLTGIHALHLSIGIAIVALIAVRAWRGAFSPAYYGLSHSLVR